MIKELDIIDIRSLNAKILEKYQVDFSEYALTSYKRRVIYAANELGVSSFENLLLKIEQEPAFYAKFESLLIVPVTEFFRDPSFWRRFIDEIKLKFINDHQIKIWVPFCSTGEELVSLAILLKQNGLYEKSKIIATDINQFVLDEVVKNTITTKAHELALSNFERVAPGKVLDEYLQKEGEYFIPHPNLFANVTFQKSSNLLDDFSTKFDVILCRNFMIYLNHNAQDKLISKFSTSLFSGGYLAIGIQETLTQSKFRNDFKEVSDEESIYKKV
jgi:chemotaxis protein methyltransferase CheR